MSIAEENVSFIKWDHETTELAELLKGYTKADLVELAGNQLIPVKKSWNKAKIADVLAGYTIEQAETIYHPVLKEALLSLPDLDTTVYRMKNLEEIQVLVPFIRQGFFFTASEKDSILLIIPEEILFSVKDRLDGGLDGQGQTAEPAERAETFQTTEESGPAETAHDGGQRKNELLNIWKERALAIYGTVSPEHLKTIWNRHFDEQVTIEEINERLNQ